MHEEEPHYLGHRQRLKQRLVNSGPESMADYELIELLLFTAIPRKDVKPLAKKLLAVFGNIANLINSGKERLLAIEGVNENVYLAFLLSRELINRTLREKILNHNIISSWDALLEYLRSTIGSLKIEQFRVLFLNKKNVLIADETMAIGTIDRAAVYPREIIKRALFHEAGALILVHNHPSGTCKPSKGDIDITDKIVQACSSINIPVYDHLIITAGEHFSFKSNMLL